MSRLLLNSFAKRTMSTLQHPTPLFHSTGSSLILIDFDQTITRNDTIDLLGQFGISQSHSTSKPWSYFVDSYLEEYRGYRDHLPDIPKGDFKAFVQQLDSYQPVEKNSLARVSKHKVFANIHRQAFVEEGARLRSKQLQAGAISTLKKYKDHIRIVSLNWSKDWILGFLTELELNKEQIYSNDLTFDQDQISIGEIVPQIITAGDKQRIIDTFKKQGDRVFYIGDSLGDIEALGTYIYT
jgi:2-hydroxy-3-keto-5-methylthiopentenyl-1-phosphate phosphatase